MSFHPRGNGMQPQDLIFSDLTFFKYNIEKVYNISDTKINLNLDKMAEAGAKCFVALESLYRGLQENIKCQLATTI